MNSSKNLWTKPFSHIYIENNVQNHPKTLQILSHLNPDQIIEIDNYAQLFNRSRQDFMLQKRAQKLILAEKHFDFYYDGSPFCENFGAKRFYYTTMVMNCLYDCSYCYLKSLYPCGHMVIFVNNDTFIQSVEKDLLTGEPLYLAISYDSDLLALESITGFIHEWINLAKAHPELTIEVKTKYPVFPFKNDVPSNVIFAWSLLPQPVIDRYESRTPSLKSRLAAINTALSRQATVRLSLEPLMPVTHSTEIYTDFASQLAASLPLHQIHDINMGGFRISGKQFKNFCRKDPYSPVLSFPFEQRGDGIVYQNEQHLKDTLYQKLISHVPDEKLVVY